MKAVEYARLVLESKYITRAALRQKIKDGIGEVVSGDLDKGNWVEFRYNKGNKRETYQFEDSPKGGLEPSKHSIWKDSNDFIKNNHKGFA